MSKYSPSPQSRLHLPPNSVSNSRTSFTHRNDEDVSPEIPKIYIDLETVQQQKANALEMVEIETKAHKERCKAEYESSQLAIEMKASHELEIAQVQVEQSQQQAIFALDQQHAQRRLEIEQRAQEQKLSIETATRQLLLQAQEQRLHRELNDKLASINRGASGILNFEPQPQVNPVRNFQTESHGEKS